MVKKDKKGKNEERKKKRFFTLKKVTEKVVNWWSKMIEDVKASRLLFRYTQE